MERGSLDVLRAARDAAQRLAVRGATFADVEAGIVAEGYDADVVRITMRHLMEDTLAVMERNERLFRHSGRALILVAIVLAIVFGLGNLFTGRGMVLHWGFFGVGLLSQVRAWLIAQRVAGMRAHRWLTPEHADPPAGHEGHP